LKRAQRHHLKQDELVHWIDRTINWGMENRRNIVNATLVVVGATLLLGGLYIYRSRQAATAQALLTAALEQYHGVVVTATGAAPPANNVPTFESVEARYQASVEAFTTVAQDFGTYAAGRQARYYVGLCRNGLSEFDAAHAEFEAVRTGDRDLLYYLATRALASVKLERDDASGAAELYRTLIDDAQTPLPRDLLLFDLAKTEEGAGNTEKAKQYYERILAEHPDSQLRGDAMTRSESLALAAEGESDTSD
jgi:tetratricopeptide (TPR) repeat protein